MEIASKNCTNRVPPGCANLFTGVFGKQEGLVFVITSRIKPEILGHVVQFFSRK